MEIAPPIPPLAALWAAARRFYANITRRFGAPRRIPLRPSRALRADLNDWIEPVEKLVRGLIIAEAVVLLLMTPEGRRMREQARPRAWPASIPVPLPARPAPEAQDEDAQDEQQDEQHQDEAARTDNAASASPAAQRHASPGPASGPAPGDADWPADPAAVDAPFPVMAWRAPAGEVLVAAAARSAGGACSTPCSSDAAASPPARQPFWRARIHRAARRIEAVARVLDNPRPHVEKAAALLAGLPDGALGRFLPARVVNPLRWPQGAVEVAQASWHTAAAIRAWISAHAHWLRERAPDDAPDDAGAATSPDTS